MKKKGFTLVELLSVIVILGVLAFLITPLIFNTINNFNKDSYDSQLDTIESAAIDYAIDNKLTSVVDKFYITLGQLKQSGYIRKDLTNPYTEMNDETDNKEWFNNDSLIEVTKTGSNYTAKYIESSSSSNSKIGSDLTKEDITLKLEGDLVTEVVNGSTLNDNVTVLAYDDSGVNISSSIVKTYYIDGVKVSTLGTMTFGRVYSVMYSVTSNGVTQSIVRNISVKALLHELAEYRFTLGATYTYDEGTYLKNSQTTNYVWFSGHLWRVMGLTKEGNVRLIMHDPISTISRANELFTLSDQYKWLNNEFYNSLDEKDYVLNEEYCSGDTPITMSSARTICNDKTLSHVTLLSVDEYNLAGGNGSYLNHGIFSLKNNSTISGSYNIKFTSGLSTSSLAYPLRPVITVNPNVEVTYGMGTLEYPFALEAPRDDQSGNLNTISKNGEYVLFDGRNYRIISKDENGTKLIMDTKHSAVTSSQIFSSSFITEGEKEKLVNYTWYKGDKLNKESSYELFLNSKSNPVESLVGAPRIGDLFTVYDPNDQYYVWTLNQGLSNQIAVSDHGYLQEMTNSWYTKPVIVVKPEIKVTAGNGMKNSPYEI